MNIVPLPVVRKVLEKRIPSSPHQSTNMQDFMVCPPCCCHSYSCPGPLCHWVLPKCHWLCVWYIPCLFTLLVMGKRSGCVWESIQQRLLYRESPLHHSAQLETHITGIHERRDQIISPIPRFAGACLHSSAIAIPSCFPLSKYGDAAHIDNLILCKDVMSSFNKMCSDIIIHTFESEFNVDEAARSFDVRSWLLGQHNIQDSIITKSS